MGGGLGCPLACPLGKGGKGGNSNSTKKTLLLYRNEGWRGAQATKRSLIKSYESSVCKPTPLSAELMRGLAV